MRNFCDYPNFIFSIFERFVLTPRPLKFALFKTFVEQQKAVPLPVERLYPVGSPAAKQEQGVCAGIEPKLLFHNGRQAVNAAAQVRVTAGKVNLLRSAKVVQHDFSAWISAVSVASSAPL